MTTVDEATLTVTEKLLLAAARLEEMGKRPFTAEDLVVAAWRDFPRTFGLRGYVTEHGDPQFPDSNRVFAEVMGSKPIRKRGLLVKVGRKLYELTSSGRELARLVQQRASANQKRDVQREGRMAISRETQTEIERLLATRAAQKFDNGLGDEITFHDACLFWGISPRSSAIDLKGSLANVKALIESLEASLRDGGTQLKSGGEPVRRDAIQLLHGVHQSMLAAFQEELAVISKRRDERRS